ncbi:hypothetical protein LCGC14_1724710 [marine sediment metagenome]|uniref:HNH nuclease domain-containing protein n=1 Tax=marine sediment metagenome TaxID=412755 RepID=A0A0F9HBF3_9ZZZZ
MVRFTIKSCGKSHPHCKQCQPEVAEKLRLTPKWAKGKKFSKQLCQRIAKGVKGAWKKGKYDTIDYVSSASGISQLVDLPKAKSARTRLKIIKRSGFGCAICGWNEAQCDMAHVIPKVEGGTYELDNIVILCPNHHRMADSGKLGTKWWVGQTLAAAVQ